MLKTHGSETFVCLSHVAFLNTDRIEHMQPFSCSIRNVLISCASVLGLVLFQIVSDFVSTD